MSFADQLKEALRIMVERKRGNYNNNWYRETSHTMPTPDRYHQLNPYDPRNSAYYNRGSAYQDYTNFNPYPYPYSQTSYHRREPEREYIPPPPPAGSGVSCRGSGIRRGKKKPSRRR